MPDAIDRDLQAGLDTLYTIQSVIGGSDQVNQEKRALEAFKGDPFMETKYTMMKKLEQTSDAMQEVKQLNAASAAPDVKIRKEQEIREALKSLTATWATLDKLYQKEAGKTKSKLAQGELVSRGEIVANLREHIDGLKNEFVADYAGGGGGGRVGQPKVQTFSEFRADMAAKSAKSGGAGPDLVKLEQEEVSAQQQQRLQQIDQRSAKQDDLVSAIDEGVTRLAAIALAMGDEVQVQGDMLRALDADLGQVQEHVESVSETLATTLKEVRDSDRFCLDVFCILLMLGIAGVFLKVYNNNKAAEAAAASSSSDTTAD